MADVDSLISQINTIKVQAKNQILKLFQDLCIELNVVLVISGETPIWNDGEPCEYSCTIYVFRPITSEEANWIYKYKHDYGIDEGVVTLNNVTYIDIEYECTEEGFKYHSSSEFDLFRNVYKVSKYKDIVEPLTTSNGNLYITPTSIQLEETEPYY